MTPEQALAELVACKDLKEQIEADGDMLVEQLEKRDGPGWRRKYQDRIADYARRKPLAWSNARLALAALAAQRGSGKRLHNDYDSTPLSTENWPTAPAAEPAGWVAALDTWLDGQEFLELCMDYRAAQYFISATGTPQYHFERLIAAIRIAAGIPVPEMKLPPSPKGLDK